MTERLYTVEQVAGLLGLHIKTVRGYVRDGRLKASRIGKSYRITASDLAAFTGTTVAPPAREVAGRHRRAEVSAVVHIDAMSPAAMTRLTSTITAAASAPIAADEPLMIQCGYDEEYATMKVVLVGGLTRTAETLRIIHALAQPPGFTDA